MNNRLIKSNDAGGACTNTVDLYNPFPDGGGVALYQLNGDATDESGNYNGTATNVTYGAGQFGQAGVFNNGYIQIPNLTIPTTATISIWAKATSGYLFSSQTSAYRREQPNMYWDGTNNRFACLSSRGDSSSWLYTGTLTAGAWHNIVLVQKSDGTAYLYANGELQDSNTTTAATYTPIAGFTIGALYEPENGGIKSPYTGEIDQVRIFNRALRPYEVEALYTEEYCTPTIVPSEHFNTVTWTGDGQPTRNITGVGFQPDLVWIKSRDQTRWHNLIDSVRGVSRDLYSNATNAEIFNDTTGTVSSFDSDGFTVNIGTVNVDDVNNNGEDYVAWNFKAGGSAVSNTDGTITSQVSANTEAGFSIVSWTGNGSNGVTIGHGLDSIPDMFIIKDRDVSQNWYIWQKDLAGDNYGLDFSTNAQTTFSFGTVGAKTASTITAVAGGNGISNLNTNGNNYIGYFFSEVEGFSKIGSYVGNGGVNTIVTGFEPAFMLFKAVDIAFPWELVDNKRPDGELNANNSDAERIENTPDFLENGFRLTTGRYNNSGQKFIYMAFAADPTAVEPSLEDSFNTVTYSGNGGTQSITGVGFQPDLTWIKVRNTVNQHFLVDDVRGNFYLRTNDTAAETAVSGFNGFTSDGFDFSLGGALYNGSGDTYVAWNWKGAEIPAINSNGSIPSVVSANPAAGFSIVSYTGNNIAGATIGHGLGVEPDVIIVKNRDTTDIWTVQHSALTYTDYIDLSSTNAATTNTAVWYAQPTNEVFSFGANPRGNGSGNKIIAYCFAEVAGFSKFGSYSGGSTGSGNVINTGFKPMFVMVKRTDIAGDAWQMFDSVRGGGDTFDNYVQANTSAAEVSYNQREINLTANGFYWTFAESGSNISGGTYIYMAFANQF